MVPVSVVIPCYGCAGTVAAAVRSVYEQSVRPLEIILVDDASEDGTREVLTHLAQQYGRGWIKIIRLSQNRGPATARNTGWDAARGEFVAFLDADDAWHPRKLEIQVGIMRSDPGIALSGHRHSFGSPAMIGAEIPRPREISARAFLWRNQFVTPSAMIRRDIPFRFLQDRRYMEDHLLWAQIAFSGLRVVLVELPLAILFKPAFGISGQSAALLQMELAELANYRRFRQEGRISPLTHLVLWLWSVGKFVRRLLVVATSRWKIR